MTKLANYDFASPFKPTTIASFGLDPSLCMTVVCSDSGSCKLLDYCSSHSLEEFVFYPGIDLGKEDIKVEAFSESSFFIIGFKTNLQVRDYSDAQSVLFSGTVTNSE